MDISFVIPNYNGEELLRQNLPKVIDAASNHKKGYTEIIVVDDCSEDESISFIKSQISNLNPSINSGLTLSEVEWVKSQNHNLKLKIIRNDINLGFSSTVNKGVKEAKGELIILLNTDVIPEKGFLDSLTKHFEESRVFAVGCMDKSVENGKIVLRGRGVGEWRRGFFVHSRGEVNKTNTLWVSCGSGAFRKSIWDKLGGLDTLYNPFYWEDIDLSYRALKSGYKILFEPKSIVVHEHEKGSIKKKYSEKEVKTIAYRNQFIFVWKNASDLDLQFLHVFWLPYHFVKAFASGERAFVLGFFQAFIRLPQVIKSKIRSQKYFIKSDRQVIKEFG